MPQSERASSPRNALRELGVFAVYQALAVAMLWPLPRYLTGHVISAKYYWDAYTNAMALGARVQNVLGTGPGGHYDSYFFAPIPHSIVLNENLFGLSLLYAPFHLATDNPLFAYNAVLLLSLALSSYFTFCLVRHISGSALAGFIAGVAFPYCPYAFFEMGRIQLVATQWIPLSFWMLHRAFEQRRLRDIAGLGVAYALQVGTCLYYAMFLLPLLGALAVYLFLRERPRDKRFFVQFAIVTACTGAIVGAMILPYFTSRRDFDLTRTEDFAESFDGELSFFGHVDMQNRAWTKLRHEAWEAGAHEEVAFPGLTIAILALFALLGHAARRLQALPAREALRTSGMLIAWLVVTVALAAGATLLTHSLLSGTLVLAAALALWLAYLPHARLAPAPVTLYTWLLALSVLLFLGLTLLDYHGKPVRGLYYYLYTYVPGWNGIRKISRQAIMTSFGFILLAGFGAQLLLSRISHDKLRLAVAVLLSGLVAFEFREAPVPLKAVPSGDKVPQAYRFIAAQPGKAPIALLPVYDGLSVFRGHRGQALDNYLALYSHRRTINGKSSFIPQVTRLFNSAMAFLPGATATRVLRSLGAQYVVVRTWDMPAERGERIVRGLRATRNAYKPVFEDGKDYVFEILPSDDPEDTLAETPKLPLSLEKVPYKGLHAAANVAPERAQRALDGKAASRWSTGRNQRLDDYYEITLATPRELGALELSSPEAIEDAALGYRVEVEDLNGVIRTVATHPHVRLFRDQVFHPRNFVFRVVFEPVQARRIRVTITDPVPSHWWTIQDATLWAKPAH